MEDKDDEFEFQKQKSSFFYQSLYGEWAEEAMCDDQERAKDINSLR